MRGINTFEFVGNGAEGGMRGINTFEFAGNGVESGMRGINTSEVAKTRVVFGAETNFYCKTLQKCYRHLQTALLHEILQLASYLLAAAAGELGDIFLLKER